MTLKISIATGTVYAVACLFEQSVFIVRNICKNCVDYYSDGTALLDLNIL